MYIKLALSTALLGTATVALAGYASTSSHKLLDTQARNCPALTGDRTTETFDINTQIEILFDENTSNRLLALNAICNGYGYGGGWFSEADLLTPNNTVAAPQSISTVESEPFVYFNHRPVSKTPQAAAKFDQLPQDRVEAVAPL